MLLWRTAPLLLFIAAVGISKAQGNSLQKIRYDLESYQGTLRQLSQYVTQADRHLLWADRDDFKQWVEKNRFNEEPFKTQLTEEWFRNLGDKLSEIQDTLRSIDGRVRVIEETNPADVKDSLHTIERRLTGTEFVTEQLQCSTSERLQPVCKRREWVTVVVGGWTGRNSDAAQVFGGDSSFVLPNITIPINANRVTIIGSALYNCGGYSTIIAGSIDECFSLNIYKEHKTWQISDPLPRASHHHHISGANGMIMTIYEDASISVTKGSKSTTYEGVFVQGSTDRRSCLAHNATHSFYLHGGIVYMNNDPMNPTDWKIISEIDLGNDNIGTACFMFESELFVTRFDKLFIMNTDTYAVRQGATPNTPRYWHGMGVIEDRVAVLGGIDSNGWFDSIETYDRKTDMWQTHHDKLVLPMYLLDIVSFKM